MNFDIELNFLKSDYNSFCLNNCIKAFIKLINDLGYKDHGHGECIKKDA
jgi:hypothetical protein